MDTERAQVVSLHDKAEIERFLRRDTFLHIYSLGDLDSFFWPGTVWYGLKAGEEIREVLLLYIPLTTPTLLALTPNPSGPMRDLLRAAIPLLPGKLYAHLTVGLEEIALEHYSYQSHGTHYKMALTDLSKLDSVDTSGVTRLTTSDLPDLLELYSIAYPDNWFDPRMLETGYYYGFRHASRLVGVAGVHVYSPEYRVAALGNVTTHPDFRGQGVATATCAGLCRELLRTVDHIGLNVKADNAGALLCYERLGFARIATYEECMLG